MSAPNDEQFAESVINLTLLDPPRWGWTAGGGVADLLPPHERARRKATKKAYNLQKRCRPAEKTQLPSADSASLKPPPPSTSTTEPPPAAAPSITETKDASEPVVAPDAGDTLGTTVEENDKSCNDGKPDSNDATAKQTSENAKPTLEASQEGQLKEPPLPAPKEGESKETNPLQSSLGEASVGKDSREQPPLSAKKSETTNNMSLSTTVGTLTVGQPPTTTTQTTPSVLETATVQPAAASNAKKQQHEQPPAAMGPNGERTLAVTAVREDGSLDIYAYHRGREGQEPRDEITGELLCDVEPTDSSYGWEEPRLCTTITISFPLYDQCDAAEAEEESLPRYEDTITWDLGDPTTPTPLIFASHVAENFGLSFGQTMDLAQSIQDQLHCFVRENCGYTNPLALTDGGGGERTNFGTPTVAHLYGDPSVPGGMLLPAVQRPRAARGSNAYQLSTSRRLSLSDGNGGRRDRPQKKERAIVVDPDEAPPEDKYIKEVLTREMEKSKIDVKAKALGPLELKNNHICHICHKRYPLVAVFPCGNLSHAYCANHMKHRLDIQVLTYSDKVSMDYCPICAVTCACSKCQRRVTALAIQVRRKSPQLVREPTAATDEDMPTANAKVPEVARAVDRPTDLAPEKPRRNSIDTSVNTPVAAAGARRMESWQQAKVPRSTSPGSGNSVRKSPAKWREIKHDAKIPASEFPREVRGGVDLDPGTADDYSTVYTADGAVFESPVITDSTTNMSTVDGGRLADPSEAVEDGNVSWCHVCKRPGKMVCCDCCPRAFHKKCLKNEEKMGAKWQCSVCLRENEMLPCDAVDGLVSHSQICAAFRDVKSSMNAGDILQISILSKIHHMVLTLIQYDFGDTFREPVTNVPGYGEVIKNPMDLGTIGAKLINGEYKKFYETRQAWDDVLLAVLKDVELVWHNCFKFNFEGSSIYRMAEVHRRRMLSIRKHSFDRDLSENLKQQLAEYVTSCLRDRGKSLDQLPAAPLSVSKQKAVAAKQSNRHHTRPIAVLDPDTGKVVKIYSTVRAASNAAAEIQNNNELFSEYPTINEHSVKNLVNQSAKDSRLRLFGYRWVGLDLLRNGQVIIPRPPKEPEIQIFQMSDGETIRIFLSVEEALSYPNLPTDLSQDVLRKTLQELREGGESVVLFGWQWRRIVPNLPAKHNNTKLDDECCGVSLNLSWRSRDEDARYCMPSRCLPENANIAKLDLVSRRTLVGFETVEAAFQDWVVACMASPTFHADEEKNLPTFYSLYLDGDRNVDGVVWRTIDKGDSSCEDGDRQSTESNEVPECDTVDMYPAKADQVDLHGQPMLTEESLPTSAENGPLPDKQDDIISKNGLRENGKHLSEENKAPPANAILPADINVGDKADGSENFPFPPTNGLKRGSEGEIPVKRKRTKISR